MNFSTNVFAYGQPPLTNRTETFPFENSSATTRCMIFFRWKASTTDRWFLEMWDSISLKVTRSDLALNASATKSANSPLDGWCVASILALVDLSFVDGSGRVAVLPLFDFFPPFLSFLSFFDFFPSLDLDFDDLPPISIENHRCRKWHSQNEF